MTVSSTNEAPTPALAGVALRAALPGLVLAATGAGLGLAGVVSPDGEVGDVVALGCSAAAVTGMFGVFLKARAVLGQSRKQDTVSDELRARIEAQRFQVALFGDFLIQLVVLGGGIVALRFGSDSGGGRGVMMGFGLAFATVALFHQIGAALVLSATLRRRARSGSPTATPNPFAAPTGSAADVSEPSSSPSVASQEPSWAASASGGRTIHAHR